MCSQGAVYHGKDIIIRLSEHVVEDDEGAEIMGTPEPDGQVFAQLGAYFTAPLTGSDIDGGGEAECAAWRVEPAHGSAMGGKQVSDLAQIFYELGSGYHPLIVPPQDKAGNGEDVKSED